MKTVILGACLVIHGMSSAQSNTFPSTGNVGIGTTAPTYPLEINSPDAVIKIASTNSSPYGALRGAYNTWLFGWVGAPDHEDISIGTQDGSGSRTLTFATGGNARMKLFADGKLGLGTFTPAGKLDIASTSGHIIMTDTDEGGQMRLERDGGGFNMDLVSTNANLFRVSDNGNVGIGTNNPQHRLEVNGDIRTKRIIVAQTGWPDYVFNPGYKLKSLSSLRDFVKANRHLPDMPAAGEIQSAGNDLSATQALLLRKIEELTLYVLRQQQEIDALKKTKNKR